MFINFSNHPSSQWNSEQKRAAAYYGEIQDIVFPKVPPMAAMQEVADMAGKYAEEIIKMQPECVMCQGEFSLTMAVVRRLQMAGIRCVCACSERRVMEEQMGNGMIQKTSVFEFFQFREYEKMDF